MTAKYQQRMARIESVLLIEKKVIDYDELRASCSYGVPDPLRPLIWRLLLDYLPVDRQKWPTFLKTQRDNYDTLVSQLIVEPGQAEEDNSEHGDHPLSEERESNWGAFFADNTTLTQIDKDVRRLCPEIQFFQMNTKFPHKSAAIIQLSKRVNGSDLEVHDYMIDKFGVANFKSSRKQASIEYANAHEKGAETHWQVAERILFIYSKLNPGVKYVQGMNEVLGPIYYVLASDDDVEWAAHAEADAFYCFQQLMSEIKDNFIKTLDDSSCGIEYLMNNFHSLLHNFDPVLHNHLVTKLSIRPQFYAFRWLSLLLSQEFALPDVINVWDALFADAKRFTLLPYFGLAMLENIREELLAGDFADCLRLLQNYPEHTDVQQLMLLAHALRDGRASRPSTSTVHDEKDGRKNSMAGKITDKLRSMNLSWK